MEGFIKFLSSQKDGSLGSKAFLICLVIQTGELVKHDIQGLHRDFETYLKNPADFFPGWLETDICLTITTMVESLNKCLFPD